VSIDVLASRAGLIPDVEPEDPLSRQALRLFRQLPRWRQEDVIAQLELYLRLRDRGPVVIGGEEEDERQEPRESLNAHREQAA